MAYLFTDEKGKKILDLKLSTNWIGDDAQRHRQKLEKTLKRTVVAWCHLGGENPKVSK